MTTTMKPDLAPPPQICGPQQPPCVEWPPLPPVPIEQATAVPAVSDFGLVGLALVVAAIAIRRFRRAA